MDRGRESKAIRPDKVGIDERERALARECNAIERRLMEGWVGPCWQG